MVAISDLSWWDRDRERREIEELEQLAVWLVALCGGGSSRR